MRLGTFRKADIVATAALALAGAIWPWSDYPGTGRRSGGAAGAEQGTTPLQRAEMEPGASTAVEPNLVHQLVTFEQMVLEVPRRTSDPAQSEALEHIQAAIEKLGLVPVHSPERLRYSGFTEGSFNELLELLQLYSSIRAGDEGIELVASLVTLSPPAETVARAGGFAEYATRQFERRSFIRVKTSRLSVPADAIASAIAHELALPGVETHAGDTLFETSQEAAFQRAVDAARLTEGKRHRVAQLLSMEGSAPPWMVESGGFDAAFELAWNGELVEEMDEPSTDVLTVFISTNAPRLQRSGQLLVEQLREHGVREGAGESEQGVEFELSSELELRRLVELLLDMVNSDTAQAAGLVDATGPEPSWLAAGGISGELERIRAQRRATDEAERNDYTVVAVRLWLDVENDLGRSWYGSFTGGAPKRTQMQQFLDQPASKSEMLKLSSVEELEKFARATPVSGGVDGALGCLRSVEPIARGNNRRASDALSAGNVRPERLPEWIGADQGSPKATIEAYLREHYPSRKELEYQAKLERRGWGTAVAQQYPLGSPELWSALEEFVRDSSLANLEWPHTFPFDEKSPPFVLFSSQQDYDEFVRQFTASELGRSYTLDEFTAAVDDYGDVKSNHPWAPQGIDVYTRDNLEECFDAAQEAFEQAELEREAEAAKHRGILAKKPGTSSIRWGRVEKLARRFDGAESLDGGEAIRFEAATNFRGFMKHMVEQQAISKPRGVTLEELWGLSELHLSGEREGLRPSWAPDGLRAFLEKEFRHELFKQKKARSRREKDKGSSNKDKRAPIRRDFQIRCLAGQSVLDDYVQNVAQRAGSSATVVQTLDTGTLVLSFSNQTKFDAFLAELAKSPESKHVSTESFGRMFTVDAPLASHDSIRSWMKGGLSAYLASKYPKGFKP